MTINTPTAYSQSVMQYAAVAGLDSSHCAVCWAIPSGGGVGVAAASLSGPTFTFGTALTITSHAYVVYAPSIAMLSSSSFVMLYQDGGGTSNYYAVIGTVSGTTVTLGTPISLGTGTGGHCSIAALSSSAFVTLRDNGAGLQTDYCTVSGTTITNIASNSVYSGGSTSLPTLGRICGLTGSTWCVVSQNGYVTAFSVSGSTITPGTSVSTLGYTEAKITAVSSTEVIVSDIDSTKALNTTVCTISGTTVSAGSTVQQTNTISSISSLSFATTMPSSTTYLFVALNGTTFNTLYVANGALSGTTLTMSANTTYTTSGVSGGFARADAMGTNAVVVFTDSSSTIYVASITFGAQLTKSVSETISLADSLAKMPVKMLLESLSLAEIFSRGRFLARVETYSFSDAFTSLRTKGAVFTETFSILESFVKATVRTFVDNLSIADIVSVGKRKLQAVADSLSLAENFGTHVVLGRIFMESISVIESIIRRLNGTSTIYSKRTKPTTNYTARTKPTTIYTPRIKP